MFINKLNRTSLFATVAVCSAAIAAMSFDLAATYGKTSQDFHLAHSPLPSFQGALAFIAGAAPFSATSHGDGISDSFSVTRSSDTSASTDLLLAGQRARVTAHTTARIMALSAPAAHKMLLAYRGSAPLARNSSAAQPATPPEVPLNQRILDAAERFLGDRYLWGGSSPAGFDCSGLTWYVFSEFGISLPRDSYGQFVAGVPVSRSQLQPGDLVFFSTYAAGPSHVGIYMGGGRFIHASSPRDGVMVSSMWSPYYANHYVGARRVR